MLEHLRELPVRQQPTWHEHPDYATVMNDLEARDPLVELHDIDRLTGQLAGVETGDAFLLHGGSCAEMFADTRLTTRDQLKTLLSMTVVLMYGAGVKVVKVGRIAGQFAKPRSSETEDVGGLILPSYRGDLVNGADATVEARQHDPKRMLWAYDHSSRTLRAIERLTRGGFADIEQMHAWNVAFAEQSQQRERYLSMTDEIGRAIAFMRASGVTDGDLDVLHKADVFSSHEGLVQDYELALTRQADDGRVFGSSAHMLWIGERTRDINEFHVGFFSEIVNPVGAKIGPTATSEEVLALCDVLNPDRIPGRLTLITRMGRDAVKEVLPPILQAVQHEGHSVVWASDPMHANTKTHTDGNKTRLLTDITAEIANTAEVHDAAGTIFGGVSLELTGDNVTECLGGTGINRVEDLGRAFETSCDPRLNGEQAVELAFAIAKTKASTSN